MPCTLWTVYLELSLNKNFLLRLCREENKNNHFLYPAKLQAPKKISYSLGIISAANSRKILQRFLLLSFQVFFPWIILFRASTDPTNNSSSDKMPFEILWFSVKKILFPQKPWRSAKSETICTVSEAKTMGACGNWLPAQQVQLEGQPSWVYRRYCL